MKTNLSYSSESGQMLLIGMMILFLLILAIPAMVFINQRASSHNVMSQNKLKGRDIGKEGLAYAIQRLESDGNILAPPAMPNCPALFDDNTVIPSSQGGGFTVSCGAGIQTYQKTLIIRPRDTTKIGKPVIAGSSIQVLVSRRTLGAKLDNGLIAPAAFEFLIGLPGDDGAHNGHKINVFFGPIVSYNTHDQLDTNYSRWRYRNPQINVIADMKWPRIFSTQGIQGSVYPPAPAANVPISDNVKYWSFTPLGHQNTVDAGILNTPGGRYKILAQNPTAVVLTCSNGAYVHDGTGLYPPAAGTVTFGPTGAAAGLTSGAPNEFFYISGTTIFENMAFDVVNGAIIINGNLTIQGNSGTGSTTDVRVPPSAHLEFPDSPATWPCRASEGLNAGCSVTTFASPDYANPTLNFRGFLYVMGTLTVNSDFTMAGVLKVDRAITIAGGNTLNIIYDDRVNRNILVSPFELQVDATTTLP